MKKWALCIILILITSPCFATDYYVDDDGTDQASCVNAPGIGDPCKTISYVIANKALVGGDNVYIREGTYAEHIVITNTDSGSSGNYVTFRSYQNENVVITWNDTDYGTIEIRGTTDTIAAQYIKFDGYGSDGGKHITVTSTDAEQCFYIRNANNIWLRSLLIDGNNKAQNGIKFLSYAQENTTDDDTGPKDCIVEYCNIYDGYDYGIKITGYGTDRNIIRYNNIYSNGGAGDDNYGMNVSGSGYATNKPDSNEIHNNSIYSNYSTGINILYTNNTSFHNNLVYSNGTGSTSARGVGVSTSTSGSLIYDNRIYDNSYYGMEVNGIIDAKIYNNVIYTNTTTDSQVMVQTSPTNLEFYNNTIYHGTNNSAIPIYVKAGTGHIFKNNNVVSAGNYAFRSDITTMTVQNNNFKSATATPCYIDSSNRTIAYLNSTWGGTADGNISEDPAWDANYALTSVSLSGVSNVRDGGLDLSATFTTDYLGKTRPQGSAWDMGAYEYDSNVPTISNPIPYGTQVCTGPTQSVTVGVSTNETANCKWDTSDHAYDVASGVTFTVTDGTVHSGVTTIASNASYTWYAVCVDESGNTNTAGTAISFSIAACNAPPQGPVTIQRGTGAHSVTVGGGSHTITVQ